MIGFLIYDLKVAALIIVFYMFYRLLLSRETFHRVNRVVLLLTAIASFVLPLCVITLHETVTVEAVPQVSIDGMQAALAEERATSWQALLPVLYIIGVLAVLGHTLLSIWKVMLIIRQSERHPQPDGTTICVTGNASVAPFSWMRYVVMNRGDYEANNAAILAHERGHIRLHHSCDVVLVDLLTALQWFNPAMWMLRQDLRAIHEYEADGAVLSQGINARQYQYLLISKATGIGGYSIANGISHSTLKNRIYMMTNKKTRSSHLLKLLALVPIVGIALALNARTVTDYVYDEPQKQQPVKKGKKAGTIKMSNQNIEVVVTESAPAEKVEGQAVKMDRVVKGKENGKPIGSNESETTFDVVEQMPQFPGGDAALMEFLSSNVRYPEEAHKKGIEGRVIATFVVKKDGSISEAKLVRSVDPQLDEEALRVINSMPNWNPGMQNGEPVNVKYTIPLTFRLQGGSKETANTPVADVANKDVDVEVDGKLVDPELLQQLKGGEIDRITIEKAKSNGERSKIVITTKKKE